MSVLDWNSGGTYNDETDLLAETRRAFEACYDAYHGTTFYADIRAGEADAEGPEPLTAEEQAIQEAVDLERRTVQLLRSVVEGAGGVLRQDTERPEEAADWTAAVPGYGRGDHWSPEDAVTALIRSLVRRIHEMRS